MTASLLGFLSAGPAATAWLLTYLVQSTVLLGGVWLLTRARRIPEELEDVLWKAALVGGVLTASLQTAGGWHPLGSLRLPGGETEAAESAFPAAVALPAAAAAPVPAVVGLPAPSTPEPASRLAVQAPARRAADPPGPPVRWPGALLALWAAGAALALVRYGAARLRLWRLVRGRSPITRGDLAERMLRLARTAGIRRRVRLTCSDALPTPVALGAAEICVPPDVLTRLSRDQQECVLAHELGHLARRDPTWLTLARVLECVFFMQPLNRVGRRRMQEVSEFLSDDWALSLTGSPVTLARCLASVATWMAASPPAVPLSGMAEYGSPFVRRIQRMLNSDFRRARSGSGRRHALAGVGALALVGLFAPGVFAAARTAVAAAPVPRAEAAPAPVPAFPARAAAPTAGEPVPGVVRAEPRAADSAVPAAATAGTAQGRAGPCWEPADRSVRPQIMILNQRYDVTWSRGGCRVSFHAQGPLEFTADETDLASLPADGFFTLEEERDGRSRRVEVGPGGQRTWTVDGAAQPFGAEARAWLAAAIPQVARVTGINARARSQALLQREGPAGVLREVAAMHSDHGRREYFSTLVREARLGDAEWRVALGELGRQDNFDAEKLALLQEALRRPAEGGPRLADVIEAAATIQTDSYVSAFLQAVAKARTLDRASQQAFLRAVGTIREDSYLRAALSGVVTARRLDPEQVEGALRAAQGLRSEPYVTAVLVEVAANYRLEGRLREAFLETARGVESAAYRRAVDSALERQGFRLPG